MTARICRVLAALALSLATNIVALPSMSPVLAAPLPQGTLDWGLNAYGQLGAASASQCGDNVSATPNSACSQTPLQLPSPGSSITAISGGGLHTLAVGSDGTAWAWGSNASGQLGATSSDTCQQYYPCSRIPLQVSNLSGVVSLAGGSDHSLAARSDGSVWAWGDNAFDQLGDGTSTNRPAPIQVVGSGGVGTLSGITAVAAGGRRSAALRSDGTVWTWGDGPLGDGGTLSRSPTPVQVVQGQPAGALTSVVAVAVGAGGGLALKADGTVWGWAGANRGAPTNAAFQVYSGYIGCCPMTGITAVAVGGSHMLALKNDGTVYAWGTNNMAQLGMGNTSDYGSSVYQVSAPSGSGLLSGVIAISAGGSHSLALSSDGTVWAWGDNDYYQMAATTGSPCVDVISFHHLCGLYPTQVRGVGGTGALSNVSAITAGGSHSLALAQSVPSNDNFANATPLSVSPGATVGPFTGSTRLATVEAGEPLHPGDQGCFIIAGHQYTSSVWFKVTPTAAGELYASTANPGTNFDTVLALYNGTALNNLNIVACDNNGDSETPPGSNPQWSSMLHAQVQAGQSYYLQLAGVGGAPSGTYALTFTLTTPTVSVAPAGVNFGSQVVGSTSTPPQTVRLTNTSTARMSLNGMSTTAEFAVANSGTCPQGPTILAGGSSCTIDLTFSPPATGVRNGGLIIHSNASGAPTTLPLSGTGVLPPPANDNFANATPITVSSSAVVGPITGSTQWATIEAGEPLHAGDGQCFVIAGHKYTSSVWFKITPTTSGDLVASTANSGTNFDTVEALYSGTAFSSLKLVACDNNGDSETPPGSSPQWSSILHAHVQAGQIYFLQLAGVGGAPSGDYALTVRLAPAPAVSLAPSSLAFGTVAVGSDSASKTVTLSNAGNAVLNIASIATTGDFWATDVCPTALAPGASCTISVVFSPITRGLRSGQLLVSDNATGSPHQVSLSGSGWGSPKSIQPPSLSSQAGGPAGIAP